MAQWLRIRRHRFNPWLGKIPWRRKRQPTPVFLPGKSHGERSLGGYSHWGQKSRKWLSMHTCIRRLQLDQARVAYSDDQLIKCPLLLVFLSPLSLTPNCFQRWSTCMKIAISAFQGFIKLGQDDRWMGWSKWSWESELGHWFEWRSREICTKAEVIGRSD